METKVDEMHAVLMQAKGVRWAVITFAALVGFLIGVGTFLLQIGKFRLAIVMALLVIGGAIAAKADPHQDHPEDLPIHEKFYSTWYMPDNPARSCCNKADCYPTEARFHNGRWQAKRREDGKWLFIPAAKIERHRDNPDGRNHLCAPPPNSAYPDTVFCFSLGAGF